MGSNWHTLRRKEICSQAFDWNPQGVRRCGQPQQKLIQSVEENYSKSGKS